MPTSERKQRELKQREDLILETARRLLLERGYLELNMDRIAHETEYSKGTIYQHFSSKEEILVALLIQSKRYVGEFLKRASCFQGKSRERLVAMAEAYDLFVRLHPHHFKTELLLQNESIRGKASSYFQSKMQAGQKQNMDIVVAVIREGISDGDLSLPPGVSPEGVVFGLWTGSFGAYVLMSWEVPFEGLGIKDPRRALRQNVQAILDGFGWHPLSKDWDYEDTRKHIHKEVFPEEERRVRAK